MTGKVRRKGEINLGVGVVRAGELPSGRREKIMLAPLEVEWAAARLSIPPSTEQQDARSSPENKSQHVGWQRQLISHEWKDPVTITTSSVNQYLHQFLLSLAKA